MELAKPRKILPTSCSTKKRIPSPGTNLTAGELRQMALSMLRCIPGDKITLELLRSSEGSAATFALGQECVPGEIDFFLSHSWHDDPVAKFKALQEVSGVCIVKRTLQLCI